MPGTEEAPAGLGAARELGRTLREQRLTHGLSYRQLARRLGLSAHSGLADYEHGRRIPSQDLVAVYELVFGLPAGRLLELRSRAFAERARERERSATEADAQTTAGAVPEAATDSASEGAPEPGSEPAPAPAPEPTSGAAITPAERPRAFVPPARRRIAVRQYPVVALLMAASFAAGALAFHSPESAAGSSAPGRGPAAPAHVAAVSTSGSSAPPVRRHGTVDLPLDDVIDLDSLQPGWELAKSPRDNPYDLEFVQRDRALSGIDDANLAVLPPGSVGTFDECAHQQAYGTELDYADIRPGRAFCVITDQRRYALLRVLVVRTAPLSVRLDITVWQPANAS